MSALDDLSGEKYGDLTIIGDTGKRKNGAQIVIARNEKTGELFEGLAVNFKRGTTTGATGSPEHRKRMRRQMSLTRSNLSDASEKVRVINARISQYKRAKGYYFDKRRNKFCASIFYEGKKKSLGSFNTEQEAINARKKAVDEQIKILEKELERL